MSNTDSSDNPADEPQNCPADDALLEVIVDAGGEGSTGEIERHLGHCPRCQRRLEEMSGTGEICATMPPATIAPGEAKESNEFDAFIERMQDRGALSLGAILADGTECEPHPERDNYSAILEPPTHPHLVGMLDDYEIEEKVATGGMGIVFKARDPALDRTVAIKVLNTALGDAAEGRERFVREAKAAAALDHENILPIYQVNHSAKAPFLVMPFIEGQTLEDVMCERGAPLPPEEIRNIVRQVASGLAIAHDRGLIHRDIKPANILMEPGTDRIRIADFGLARTVWDPALTQSGVITGTPLFMSPEQAGDEPVDARSDLFSLGAMTYYLATAKYPFAAARSLTVLRKVRDEEPVPVAELNAETPPWLAGLISRLMKKDPADRPQSAEEILAMLEHPEATSDEVPTARASPKSSTSPAKRRPMPFILASCGALAGIAAVAIALRDNFAPSDHSDSISLAADGDQQRAAVAAESLTANIIRRSGDTEPAASLTEAGRKVRAGDVIELSTTNGTAFITPTIRINKAITIRAAEGHTPVIEAAGPVFQTASALRIEGLHLRSTVSNTPVIRTGGRDLTITNCRIENLIPPSRPSQRQLKVANPVLVEPLIHCDGAASIQIRNSILVSRSTVLRLQHTKTKPDQSAAKILLGNTVVQSKAGLVLELGSDVDVDLRRCLLRTDTHLFTLHRNPRSAQNGKCSLRARSSSFACSGPIIAFGSKEIVKATDASFDSNAWIQPSIWSAGIFGGRRQNLRLSDRSLVTRDHVAFIRLLDADETRQKLVKGKIGPNESLESVARRFPERCRPEARHIGPGEAYDTFRNTALYQRVFNGRIGRGKM